MVNPVEAKRARTLQAAVSQAQARPAAPMAAGKMVVNQVAKQAANLAVKVAARAAAPAAKVVRRNRRWVYRNPGAAACRRWVSLHPAPVHQAPADKDRALKQAAVRLLILLPPCRPRRADVPQTKASSPARVVAHQVPRAGKPAAAARRVVASPVVASPVAASPVVVNPAAVNLVVIPAAECPVERQARKAARQAKVAHQRTVRACRVMQAVQQAPRAVAKPVVAARPVVPPVRRVECRDRPARATVQVACPQLGATPAADRRAAPMLVGPVLARVTHQLPEVQKAVRPVVEEAGRDADR